MNATLVRPKTRGDCIGGPRPCPWVSCKYHLLLDVVRGGVKLNHDVDDIDQLAETCALDVADRPPAQGTPGGREGATLEVVGQAMGLTRERIRQIEVKALEKLTRAGIRLGAYEVLDDAEAIARRFAPEIAKSRTRRRVPSARRSRRARRSP